MITVRRRRRRVKKWNIYDIESPYYCGSRDRRLDTHRHHCRSKTDGHKTNPPLASFWHKTNIASRRESSLVSVSGSKGTWPRPGGITSGESFPIEKFGLLLGWGDDKCCKSVQIELPLKVVAEIAGLLPLVGNVRLSILSLNVVIGQIMWAKCCLGFWPT